MEPRENFTPNPEFFPSTPLMSRELAHEKPNRGFISFATLPPLPRVVERRREEWPDEWSRGGGVLERDITGRWSNYLKEKKGRGLEREKQAVVVFFVYYCVSRVDVGVDIVRLRDSLGMELCYFYGTIRYDETLSSLSVCWLENGARSWWKYLFGERIIARLYLKIIHVSLETYRID